MSNLDVFTADWDLTNGIDPSQVFINSVRESLN